MVLIESLGCAHGGAQRDQESQGCRRTEARGHIAWNVEDELAIPMDCTRTDKGIPIDSVLLFTKGMAATLLRHRRSPAAMSKRWWLRGDGFELECIEHRGPEQGRGMNEAASARVASSTW
jgi:hypothetical protein